MPSSLTVLYPKVNGRGGVVQSDSGEKSRMGASILLSPAEFSEKNSVNQLTETRLAGHALKRSESPVTRFCSLG